MSDKRKEYARLYREANREIIRAKRKKYKEEHKEDIKRKDKIYREKNLEKIKANQKKYRDKNKEKTAIRNAKYRRENINKLRFKRIRNKYGLSEEEYTALLVNQSNSCAICKTKETQLNKRLCIDHCHETGKVRGLLCDSCNKGLGSFKDTTSIVRKALIYLELYD